MCPIEIAHLIDVPAVRLLLDSLFHLVGIPAILVDAEGRGVVASCGQHRYPECLRLPADVSPGQFQVDAESVAVCMGHNGLTQAAVPVEIDGQHLATLICCPFTVTRQTPVSGSAQPHERNCGASELAPVISGERCRALRTFLRAVAEAIAAMGLARACELRSQREAREGELAYRTLFNESPFAVALNRESGEYVDVNDEFCRMVGRARTDLVGKTPAEAGILDFETQQAMRAAFNATRRLEGYEFTARGPGARCLRCLAYARGIELRGESLFLLIVRDITGQADAERQQRELDAQLRQTKKMETLGRLASGIAHDLNNLLTPILGYAELAQMKLEPEEKAHLDVREIQDAVRRARDLTHQLLAFSRAQPLELTLVNMSAIVAQLERTLRRIIREDIRLTCQLAPGLGLVRGDAAQLQHVLLSLVLNASDTMPTGGSLTIETDEATCPALDAPTRSAAPLRSYVRLIVTDSGSGMDPEIPGRLVEPFSTTTLEWKGAGLGLATGYSIVKQHGGEIRVESIPGRGRTVTVFLPRVADGAGEHGTRGTLGLPAGKETILVVDDAVAIRGLVQQILRANGYASLAASNSEEATRTVREFLGPIHLLITDVIMPDMNGRQLYAALRTIRPELRVLYISGYGDDVIAAHGVPEPGTHFLAKPFTMAALNRKIREALEDAA